jgi:phosphate transport system ATP-binding protein
MTQPSHIHVENLTVYYGREPSLRNVTFDIPDRQLIAIIGPSGCGKTTFLKCLNRMVDLVEGVKVSGRVMVNGEDIYDPKVEVTHIRRKMGLLSQTPRPLPMSIYDNVAYGPRIHGIRDKRRLDEIVEFRLRQASLWDEVKDRLHSPASKISIGQQQRLCLARGLAVQPDIILADEPTSALDPMSSRRIEESFLELKKDYTTILVTHILRQARRLADYVAFFYCGELIEHGPAQQMFEEPRERMTREYMKGVIS